jgi:hypothetical protein
MGYSTFHVIDIASTPLRDESRDIRITRTNGKVGTSLQINHEMWMSGGLESWRVDCQRGPEDGVMLQSSPSLCGPKGSPAELV